MATVDVLVQIGSDRYTGLLCSAEAGAVLESYSQEMAHVPRFRDFDTASAAIVANRMMMAALSGCHHDVCIAAYWLLLRRPEEEQGYPAHKALDRMFRNCGGARLILVADELCQLQSIHGHITAPWTPDDDPSIDLTPRMSERAA